MSYHERKSRVSDLISHISQAWNLYICVENHIIAVNILNFIAHEFYKMGFFYNAFKSFLFLEKFAPTPENYNGKLASTIGNLIIFI